jgi:hypothetical protein
MFFRRFVASPVNLKTLKIGNGLLQISNAFLKLQIDENIKAFLNRTNAGWKQI